MGLLDGMLQQALGGRGGGGGLGSIVAMAARNPQLLAALAGLLSTRDATIGGAGGLGGLVSAFQGKGLGDMVASWIATGPNPAITAEQVTSVLGGDTLAQFARKAGMPVAQAGPALAELLPTAVDYLTPEGKLPDVDSLENTLSSLLSKLGS